MYRGYPTAPRGVPIEVALSLLVSTIIAEEIPRWRSWPALVLLVKWVERYLEELPILGGI